MSARESWAVYRNPSDYPGKWVARRFKNGKPTKTVLVAASLEQVRAMLPARLVCVGRFEEDPPQLLETWQ